MKPNQEKLSTQLSRRSFLSTSASCVGWLAASSTLGLFGTVFAQEPDSCSYFKGHWSESLQKRLAMRKRRLLHLSWHTVRNSWFALDSDQRGQIEALGWKPDRPSIRQAEWDLARSWRTGNTFWDTENGSGEDFLFMHRIMISIVDGWLKKEGKKPLVGWSNQDTIPAPGGGCPATPGSVGESVPQWHHSNPVLDRRLQYLKSDAFYWGKMAYENAQYRNPGFLRTVTLGQLGAWIESTTHNNMHMRWSAQAWHPDSESYKGDGRPSWDLDLKWDDSRYDALFDEHSSHVHENFWRLHKWVDNRINDWAEANADRVKPDTVHGVDWFKVDGELVQVENPWMGQGSFATDDDPGGDIPKMERVIQIIDPPPETEGEMLRASSTRSRAVNLRNMF